VNALLNAVLFQAVWLATVAGAGAGYWWTGLPALLLFAGWQLHVSRWPRSDITLLACAAVLGFVVDSALLHGGWLSYATPMPSTRFAPAWILVLWAGFALTVNHSLAFLKPHAGWTLAFGAIGGPLAYFGAARLFRAVQFDAPLVEVTLMLGLLWAVAMLLLVALAKRLVAHEAVPA
jgi:hypothetical protein